MFPQPFKTLTIVTGLFLAGPVSAQNIDPKVEDLIVALGLPELMEIMREEGLEYGAEIGTDLLPGNPGSDWDGLVDAIYDLDNMRAQMNANFANALEGDDVSAMLSFFSAEPGKSIIELEIAARRALLDDDVEEAAKEVAAIAAADETDRYKQIETFISSNGLIETNVVGALNSNFAFYTGLMDGGAFPAELTEDQILADVWSQEPEIRANTTEWIYSFLMLAYEPLEDDELDAYIAFSNTDAGQDLNAALFTAFDDIFESISRGLGLASAQIMGQQEL